VIIILPSTIGLIIFLFIIFLLYIIKNPEKVDQWSYLYNKYKIFKDEKSEKRVISANLDYKISSIAKQINKEADGIIPFGLRLMWRDTSEIESYVKANEVVVVLKKQDNFDKNIIEASMAFVPKALIPKSRNCIDEDLLKSLDVFVTKKMLNCGTYDSAYNLFIKSIYEPFLQKGKNKKYLFLYNNLDEIGFFTRVLLEEFHRIGNKLYGTSEEMGFRQESIRFLEFLETFTKRKPGERTPLIFNGDKIKIAIILVAKKETIEEHGIEAYTHRIKKEVEAGAQRIFFFSYAQRIDEMVEDSNGYVIDFRRRKEFINLINIEKSCQKLLFIRLLKKNKYYSKDSSGNKRKSMYLLYEPIR